uniref:Uncharacterized protein n=1 Tax=Oryza punctata TaxID=4537 RepID=A0A0E0KQH7_ORYPU
MAGGWRRSLGCRSSHPEAVGLAERAEPALVVLRGCRSPEANGEVAGEREAAMAASLARQQMVLLVAPDSQKTH